MMKLDNLGDDSFVEASCTDCGDVLCYCGICHSCEYEETQRKVEQDADGDTDQLENLDART